MPGSLTQGANTQPQEQALFDEQVAPTKDDYKFSTALDPLFNSTGF